MKSKNYGIHQKIRTELEQKLFEKLVEINKNSLDIKTETKKLKKIIEKI